MHQEYHHHTYSSSCHDHHYHHPELQDSGRQLSSEAEGVDWPLEGTGELIWDFLSARLPAAVISIDQYYCWVLPEQLPCEVRF